MCWGVQKEKGILTDRVLFFDYGSEFVAQKLFYKKDSTFLWNITITNRYNVRTLWIDNKNNSNIVGMSKKWHKNGYNAQKTRKNC